MYVLAEPGKPTLAFILPPKTGTRSLEHALAGQLKASKRGSRHTVDQTVVEQADLVVSSVRNPFDVLVSWYHYHGAGEQSKRSIDEWLQFIWENPDRNRHLEYSTLPGAEFAEGFVRHECGLEPQLNRVLREHGYGEVRLPHVGAAEKRRPYREYYSDALRQAVEEKYPRDFILYEYTF